MTKTDKILEDVTFHLNHLTAQHHTMHHIIEKSPPYIPDLQLTKLKQKKLHLKDELENFKHQLEIISHIS